MGANKHAKNSINRKGQFRGRRPGVCTPSAHQPRQLGACSSYRHKVIAPARHEAMHPLPA